LVTAQKNQGNQRTFFGRAKKKKPRVFVCVTGATTWRGGLEGAKQATARTHAGNRRNSIQKKKCKSGMSMRRQI